MICPKCGVDMPAASNFCPKCGAAIGGQTSGPPAGGRTEDAPEQEVWQGSYSAKAMIGGWMACILLTIVGIIVSVFVGGSGLTVAIVLPIVWLIQLAVLLYRRMSIHYRLTSYYFYQERGLLWRRADRMEFINMNDTEVLQGPIERMLGVGTIRIDSTDSTDPTLYVNGIDNVREVASHIDKFRHTARMRRGMLMQPGATEHSAGTATHTDS